MSEMNMNNMEENQKIEEVEAEVIEEGAKAVTMEEVEQAGYSSDAGNQGDTANAGSSAGTSYEQTAAAANNTKTLGIISMILGIFSLICCCTCWLGIIAGVASIILGIVSLKNEPAAKTMAIIGIVCGGVGVAIGLVGAIIAGIVSHAGSGIDSTFGTEFEHIFENYMDL